MTKLQKTRQLLMTQIKNIESGTANLTEVAAVVSISDALTKTYNTELRAKELEVRAIESDTTLEGLDVFEDMQEV